jgi:tetratricopeptide (TPR) repeat protein
MSPRSKALGVVATAWLITSSAATAVAQPALPNIPLEQFPEAPRRVIGAAVDEARAHPDDAARLGHLAMLLHAWEQYEAATAIYERARGREARFDWFYLGGLVEARRAQHAEAARLLEQAVKLAPDHVPARLALADALFAAGGTDAALAAYTPLTTGPGAPHAHYGVGRALAAEGDAAAALRELDQALALYPEFGAAWYARGMSLRALGRIDDAKAALAKAQEFGARWPAVEDPLLALVRALREDATAHAERALSLERQGEVAGAIREYEAAVAADPGHAASHVNLIALYGRQQDWTRAAAHYRALVDAGGNPPAEAHFNYGICLAAQGQLEPAADLFQKALAINPQYTSAWLSLGQIAEMSGRIDEAETSYRRAVEQAPADPAARFNLARMLIAGRQYSEAIAILAPVSDRDLPDRPRYLFALATAYVLSGDVATGRERAIVARDLARQKGQRELAEAIERELGKLGQE